MVVHAQGKRRAAQLSGDQRRAGGQGGREKGGVGVRAEAAGAAASDVYAAYRQQRSGVYVGGRGGVERRSYATRIRRGGVESHLGDASSRGDCAARPNSLDPALRRSGRFDAEIIIPIPDKEARKHAEKRHRFDL